MKLFAFISALALALPASATPQSPDYTNGGQCAGGPGSGCRYSLEIVTPNQDELVVYDPYFGPSLAKTVSLCLSEVGVANADDLITDSQLEGYEACMLTNP